MKSNVSCFPLHPKTINAFAMWRAAAQSVIHSHYADESQLHPRILKLSMNLQCGLQQHNPQLIIIMQINPKFSKVDIDKLGWTNISKVVSDSPNLSRSIMSSGLVRLDVLQVVLQPKKITIYYDDYYICPLTLFNQINFSERRPSRSSSPSSNYQIKCFC
jgi:hypothetical protein